MIHFPCKAAKIFLLSAASAMILAGFAAADDLAVGVAKTTGNALRMRQYPTTEADVVMNLDKNDMVALIERAEDDNNWWKVAYQGKTGYISANYLDELENGEFSARAQVNGEGVYVRYLPSDESDVLQVIDNKAYVTVMACYDGWFLVRCQYGTEGYIRSDFLQLTTNSTSSSSSSSTSSGNSSVVAVARRYLGIRYVYGGASTRGFDCSGFTMYVCKQFGVSMPHSASGQWTSGKGKKVYSISALRAGDLVFFRDPKVAKGKAASHVGIYIGNNQFIHASSSKKKITYGTLASGYHRTYFIGGLRFT